MLEICALLADPVRAHVHVREDGAATSGRAGRSSRRCSCSGSRRPVIAIDFEIDGNPKLDAVGATRSDARQHGGQGGALRRRPPPALFAASTTGTSTGAVNSTHDSFTPLGGAVPLVNMMLGEVSPGGVGAGLYGMLVFALSRCSSPGLMVGRTPEYLGKKIQAAEMKLVVLYILVVPLVSSPSRRSRVVLDDGEVVDPQPRRRTASPRSSTRSRRRRTTTARRSAA